MKFINTIVRIKMFVDLFSIQTTNDDDKLCISQQMNEKRLTKQNKTNKIDIYFSEQNPIVITSRT